MFLRRIGVFLSGSLAVLACGGGSGGTGGVPAQPSQDPAPNTRESPGPSREDPGTTRENPGGGEASGSGCIPCNLTLHCSETEGSQTVSVGLTLTTVGNACVVSVQGSNDKTPVSLACDGTIVDSENGKVAGSLTSLGDGQYSLCTPVMAQGTVTEQCVSCSTASTAVDAGNVIQGGGTPGRSGASGGG